MYMIAAMMPRIPMTARTITSVCRPEDAELLVFMSSPRYTLARSLPGLPDEHEATASQREHAHDERCGRPQVVVRGDEHDTDHADDNPNRHQDHGRRPVRRLPARSGGRTHASSYMVHVGMLTGAQPTHFIADGRTLLRSAHPQQPGRLQAQKLTKDELIRGVPGAISVLPGSPPSQRLAARGRRARRKSRTTYSPRFSGLARSTRPPLRLATSSTKAVSRTSSA